MNYQKDREEPVFLVVCSYCDKKFHKSKPNDLTATIQNTTTPLFISHGTCPDCLLKYFPNEYLRIQKDSRLRIKSIFKKRYIEISSKTTN